MFNTCKILTSRGELDTKDIGKELLWKDRVKRREKTDEEGEEAELNPKDPFVFKVALRPSSWGDIVKGF